MKNILILTGLLALVCGNANAQLFSTFRSAVIVRRDSTEIKCFAQYPFTPHCKTIKFKTGRDEKPQQIESGEIIAIRYVVVEEKEYLPYISLCNRRKGRREYSGPVWMDVLERGPETLYYTRKTHSDSRGRKTVTYCYYCKREHEDIPVEITHTTRSGGYSVDELKAIVAKLMAEKQ